MPKVNHNPQPAANAVQAELKWERPRIYNSIQTPFSAIIRSTILG